MTTQPKLLTADDLLRLHSQGVGGELIRGVLYETMPTGWRHGGVLMRLGAELTNFIRPRELGRLAGGDPGIWLERRPDTVRAADIAFISMSRMPPDVTTTGYTEIVPDMVVEIVSHNDTQREIVAKASMWLSFGVRLVWVVQPDTRTVDVYLPGQDRATTDENGTLEGMDVLPGFTLPVREIFED